jgi:elongation factor 1-alpha
MCFRQVVYGYVLFLSRLGVKNLVVAVNKMDTAQYAEERFEEIATNVCVCADFKACSTEVHLTAAAIAGAQVREYIQKYFDIKSVAFVPISGWLSENIDKPCDKMPWYKGWTVERHISGKACTVCRVAWMGIDAVQRICCTLQGSCIRFFTVKIKRKVFDQEYLCAACRCRK